MTPSKARQHPTPAPGTPAAAAPGKPVEKPLTRAEIRLLRAACRALRSEAKYVEKDPWESGLLDVRTNKRIDLIKLVKIIEEKLL